MDTANVSRRTFLKGSVAAAALAGAGTLTLSDWSCEQAVAQGVTKQVPTLCNACSSKCGMMATIKDGKLYELQGIKDHPYAKGHICARGHGFAQLAYSKERVTEPLKRKEDGTFEAISWDQAMQEIGEKTRNIVAKYGADSVSFINDPRPTGKTWGKNFMHALGSNNIYTHAAACNLSKESGFFHVIGAGSFSADIANAKEVVFIGRSYADGIRPSSVASLAKAAENSGTKIVLVDPRLSNSGVFADQWIPIKPGTDLALLLAICNVLVTEDLYNHDFIATQTEGFDQWAPTIAEYTPAWAEKITDVSANTITTLARELAEKAPAAVIEPSWRAAFGCSYKNSGDTARAVCLVNALLGNWNQKGGALMTGSPKAGEIDKAKFPTPGTPAGKRTGDVTYPLAISSAGSALAVLEQAQAGTAHAVFFYTSNAMHSYAHPDTWADAMKNVDLKVDIEVQMSETAMQCDYVLPECTYIERTEVPEWIGGKTYNVSLRKQAVDVIHPQTKPADEIFNLLAHACGVGDTFTYSAEDLGRAQIESLGLSYDELCEKGVLKVDGSTFEYGTAPKWATPTGKLQFVSPAHEAAGLDPMVHWIEPAVMPKQGEFRLIGGKQGIHSHSMTTNVPVLHAISEQYDMERIWINASVAEEYGIKDNDLVEISNAQHTGRVRARVTERLRKDCLFLPTHYGDTAPELTLSYNFGLCNADFSEFKTEPGIGSTMSQEIAVTLKKVNA